MVIFKRTRISSFFRCEKPITVYQTFPYGGDKRDKMVEIDVRSVRKTFSYRLTPRSKKRRKKKLVKEKQKKKKKKMYR